MGDPPFQPAGRQAGGQEVLSFQPSSPRRVELTFHVSALRRGVDPELTRTLRATTILSALQTQRKHSFIPQIFSSRHGLRAQSSPEGLIQSRCWLQVAHNLWGKFQSNSFLASSLVLFLRLSPLATQQDLWGYRGWVCVCGCGVDGLLALFSLTGSASFTHSHQGNTPSFGGGSELDWSGQEGPPSDS